MPRTRPFAFKPIKIPSIEISKIELELEKINRKLDFIIGKMK